jgi:hypothetical protein
MDSENRVSRGMLRILGTHVDFIVQGRSAHDFEPAIFNLDRGETRSNALGRYACRYLTNAASIRVNRSEYTMHVINVGLRHAGRTYSSAETRI